MTVSPPLASMFVPVPKACLSVALGPLCVTQAFVKAEADLCADTLRTSTTPLALEPSANPAAACLCRCCCCCSSRRQRHSGKARRTGDDRSSTSKRPLSKRTRQLRSHSKAMRMVGQEQELPIQQKIKQAALFVRVRGCTGSEPLVCLFACLLVLLCFVAGWTR